MDNKFDFLGELKALCAKLELDQQFLPFDATVEQIANDLQRVREIQDEAVFDKEYWTLRETYDAFVNARKKQAEELVRQLERIKKAVMQQYDAEQNELMDLNNSFWSGKQPAE